MDQAAESLIRETVNASNEGRIHFGQVIENLIRVGVESYSVDYRTGRITHYMPDGEVLTLEQSLTSEPIAGAFSAAGVKEAIVLAQCGEIMYPQFKQRTHAAGCVGYTVWIAGRHVSYYGRKGETHVEAFPS